MNKITIKDKRLLAVDMYLRNNSKKEIENSLEISTQELNNILLNSLPLDTVEDGKAVRHCIECGKVTDKSSCFCSLKCRIRYNQNKSIVRKVCPICNKEFETLTDMDFCSIRCASQKETPRKRSRVSLSEEQKKKIIKLRESGMSYAQIVKQTGISVYYVSRCCEEFGLSGNIRCRLDSTYTPRLGKCKRCGKEFLIYQTENASNPSQFCSRKCCLDNCNESSMKQYAVLRTVCCKTCGKPFTPSRYHHIYCSVKCRREKANQ